MKSKIIPTTLVLIGFIAGASALSVLADWTAAPGIPPTCPSGSPGCDAPINVGGLSQTKNGPLLLNWLSTATDGVGLKVLGSVKISDGNVVANTRKVLTDVNGTGVGTWQTLAAITSPKIYTFTTLNNTTSRLITFYGCDTCNSLITKTVKDALAMNGGSRLYDDSITLSHFCEAVTPDAPNYGAYSRGSYSSPEDNGVIYWNVSKNGFVLRGAKGMNSGIDSGNLQCSSIQNINVN